MPQELAKVPPIPVGMEELLFAFLEMSALRGSNGFSVLPITLHDIAAWQTLNNLTFTPWEIGTLLELDRCAIKIWSKKPADKTE